MRTSSSPAFPSRANEAIVRAELIKMIFEGSATTTVATIVGTIVIAAIFTVLNQSGDNATMAWTWCAATVLVLLYGEWVTWRVDKVRQRPAHLLKFETKLVVIAGFIGATFAMTSWLLLPAASPMAEAFLAITMSMALMGGASYQAPHWRMQLAFSVTFGVVFSSGVARFGDLYHIALATTFAVYTVTAILFARNQEIAIRRQLLSSLENQSLRSIAEAERERADAASQAKTAFLAAASHDLRQPLHALVQYSAHLSRALRDPELEDTVRRVGSSVDAMRDLLDSILDLSKLMVGGVQPIVAAFPIEPLLARLDVQLRPLADAKGLQLLAQQSCSALVLSDDVLLERILRNLILNAIRYTSHGQVTVRCRQRRAKLQIQVWDTGIGIPPSELRRIFDPFYQVNNRARNRRNGLGLGLAIVRQLCDLLGYRVKVRTKVGRGTVFAITVPLNTDVRLMSMSRPPSDGSVRDYVRGAFVVLVDDDQLSREATEHTLKAFGCRIIAAASHQEAIEKLQHQEFAPQLIVADYRLETETGIEAIQAVTASLQGTFGEMFSFPALVLSGDTAPEELKRVNDKGYPMLHKPVATDDLWNELNGLLERKAQDTEF